jgi:hypothetical protein
MVLIVLAAACILSVPLTGGRLGRLAALRLRCLWLAPVALALQVLIVNIVPSGNHAVHVAVHIGTYGLLVLFLWINRAIVGTRTIAVGTLSNTAAILSNGGVMPASIRAQRLAGLYEGGGFHNSAAVAHPHLLWLGDIIPVPGPLPNVLSVGDLIIFAGMLVLLHTTCRRAPALEVPAEIHLDADHAAVAEGEHLGVAKPRALVRGGLVGDDELVA